MYVYELAGGSPSLRPSMAPWHTPDSIDVHVSRQAPAGAAACCKCCMSLLYSQPHQRACPLITHRAVQGRIVMPGQQSEHAG